MDAGIPQAEARNANECARGGSLPTFYRACTRAFEHPPANNKETGSTTHTCEHRVRAKGCAQQLQNRAATGANVSFRGPRLSSMPLLL